MYEQTIALFIVDWIAYLTVPVAFIAWCIANIKINCDSVKRIENAE